MNKGNVLLYLFIMMLIIAMNPSFAQNNKFSDDDLFSLRLKYREQLNNAIIPSNTNLRTLNLFHLKSESRKLWEDHIVYTRNFIISALADLQDLTDVTNRLLKNQDDIGNFFAPVYGKSAGDALATLLRIHITLAAKVVMAAKAGDNDAFEKARIEWYSNANDIATQLHHMNPVFYNRTKIISMLDYHLEYTIGQTASRLKKDWKADIDFYDRNHSHMLMFADYLVGIHHD